MSRHLIAAGLALALYCCVQLTHAALPPSISGAWYNPAQPGHGLSVEILADGRALAFWYVYDPDGNPVHLYLGGDVVGNRIHAQAYLSRGMRFGVFDPQEHQFLHWGTVVLAFEDCNTATLTWDADGVAGAGYGAGSMPLARLTAIAGLACTSLDGEASLLPAGRYDGTMNPASGPGATLHAAVDSSGRLWATQTWTPTKPYVGPIVVVYRGTPTSDALTLELGAHINFALTELDLPGELDHEPITFVESPPGVFEGSTELGASLLVTTVASFSHDTSAPDPLRRAFAAGELAGRTFTFRARWQFFFVDHRVRFLAGGRLCLDTHLKTCALEGSYRAADPGLAMFDFDGLHADTRYEGKGWLGTAPDGSEELVMVAIGSEGPSAGTGLGLVAQPGD